MKRKATLLAALLCLFTFVVAEAQSLPSAKPEQVGLSSERLNKIAATLKADADKGVIPGAVLLVARHGKVVLFEAVGVRNPETKAPMTKDAIFRIYSMSKPITSVAAMTLFEEGRFSLAEPVSKYLPQMGGLKVGVEKPDAGGTYFWVDPKEEMFVVFMMQSPKQRVPYRFLLKEMVYARSPSPQSNAGLSA